MKSVFRKKQKAAEEENELMNIGEKKEKEEEVHAEGKTQSLKKERMGAKKRKSSSHTLVITSLDAGKKVTKWNNN